MDEQTTTPLRTDTPHRDLREFIDRVEGVGELKRIRGAHWDLEMGCLAELVYQSGQAQPPAILFEDLPGYPGFRCVAGLTNPSQRPALTPCFPSAKHPTDTIQSYRDPVK